MQNVELKLNSDYIFFPIKKLIGSSHSTTLTGLRAIEHLTELPNPTFEEVQMMQFSSTEEKNLETIKQEFKNWILIKGFEEIHSAIRDSLERFLVYIKIYAEFKSKTFTAEGFSEFEKTITIKVKKLPYPILVKEITELIGESLIYEHDIESINNIRNCLVHDYGKVTANRCNNPEKNQLYVSGSRFTLFYQSENDDERFPFELNQILPQGASLKMGAEKFLISFKVNEKISLSYSDYLHILNTCLFYEADLRDKIIKYCA
jgi:hypothetical protein